MCLTIYKIVVVGEVNRFKIQNERYSANNYVQTDVLEVGKEAVNDGEACGSWQ